MTPQATKLAVVFCGSVKPRPGHHFESEFGGERGNVGALGRSVSTNSAGQATEQREVATHLVARWVAVLCRALPGTIPGIGDTTEATIPFRGRDRSIEQRPCADHNTSRDADRDERLDQASGHRGSGRSNRLVGLNAAWGKQSTAHPWTGNDVSLMTVCCRNSFDAKAPGCRQPSRRFEPVKYHQAEAHKLQAQRMLTWSFAGAKGDARASAGIRLQLADDSA